MDAPKLTKAQQKQAGIDLLRTLRLNIEALGVPSDKARSAIYDALIVTADGVLPGGKIEATIAVDSALAWLNEPDANNPNVPDAGHPVPSIRWQDRLGRPMMFMGAPQYQWATFSNAQINAALDAISAAGLDGPSIEFGGTFIRDEYNKVPNTQDIVDIIDRQIEAWKPWDAAIRARGQVAHIAFLNANQSKANRMSDQLWQAKARTFARTYGPDNKLVLPLSESDKRCRASIGDAIAKGLVEGRIPKSQIISMAGKWGDWREVHHGRGKVPSGNRLTINVNDNRDGISDLYGSKWQQGGTPNLPHIEEYVIEVRNKGVSGAVYSFGTVFDFAGCAAAGKGWSLRVVPGQPGDAPILSNVRQDGRKFYVKWDNTPDVDAWPVVDGCIGWIVCDGVRVEKFRNGYGKQGQHLKNAYGRDEHALPGIAKGRVVRFWLQQIKNSKVRTNEVSFTIPWDGRP